ncbi:OTU domain-containing protein 3 isoform 1 [Mus musculus]|uniref:OTU domain-containing protein 3 isoform 1 n=2 Tax=Mus musculus TaxID=10090 RepID=UPI0007EC3ABD|nr:OTU domain-containing protein 3 isoform 1 [Mus musculus]|eukprot:XP_017175894.1 PREDICTED: OTU domain-containing protein 3 isoform X1 [Mus musculus]
MSRKQAAKSRPGSGGRRAEAERKRDERAARRALAKERRNRPDPGGSGCEEEFVSFANQLQALGLKLREVPGDGNCLFRALGDQLEGHSRNHLKHRQETVDYMIRQREDFEPFVEDDIPFEKHVASLSKPGTFAGNDAIVAFARNHQLNVVIHQLNAPLWQIRGTDKGSTRELHIAYRYGEHYDSVRRINDNSEAPAHLLTDVSEAQLLLLSGLQETGAELCPQLSPSGPLLSLPLREPAIQSIAKAVQFQMLHQDGANKKEKMKTKGVDVKDGLRDDVEDAVHKVGSATGCTDFNLIVQNLEAENYNIKSAITALLQVNQGTGNDAEENHEPGDRVKQRGPSREEAGSGRRLSGNQGRNEGRMETSEARASPAEESKAHKSQLPKVTNKQRREQQRLEKKKRQEERHRLKALENRNGSRDTGRSEADMNTQVTLVKTFAALNI